MKFFAVFAAVLALAAAAPASLTTQWTLNDLSEAIQNPATPAEMIPYIEEALNAMMEQLFAGQHVESIVIPTPVGLLPVEAIEAASPAAVMPVGVVEAPVAPVVVAEPVPAAINDASGSPLVQIIVNIKSQEVVAETPAAVEEASPVLIPEPVLVVDEAEQIPEAVIVAPSPVEVAPVPVPEPIVIAPSPVEVAPAPSPIEIAPVPVPEPIVIAPAPEPEPIVVAPAPEPIEIAPVPVPEPIEIAPLPVNPIDVIAVGTPEINPIDLLQPVPVAVAAGESQEGILV